MKLLKSNKWLYSFLLIGLICYESKAQRNKDELIVTATTLIAEANKNIESKSCSGLISALELYNAYEVLALVYDDIFNSINKKVRALELEIFNQNCQSNPGRSNVGSFTTFKFSPLNNPPNNEVRAVLPASVLASHFMSPEARLSYINSLDTESKYQFLTWTQQNIELNGSLSGFVKSKFGTDKLMSENTLENSLSQIDLGLLNITKKDWEVIQNTIKANLNLKND
ncbi:hypothetical protein [Roseivirga misakiensis]|uniref:Uncharacterized protein n=1 Tax=Roseivirga misakiensis TaxID=1563681 RepID=A0A1E5SZZ7_9BACT|nr:hypothetical protein [Roseivirga misakiensis]OEK04627.1 hypothetical protein BFP71_14320 [Roseivirga misakiensis]